MGFVERRGADGSVDFYVDGHGSLLGRKRPEATRFA
jgi:hypothetical protein